MSKVETVNAQANTDSGTTQIDANTEQADTDSDIAQADTDSDAEQSEPNTMPGQEVLPSVDSKTKWEMPITIHNQGIKEWYNYIVTMKVSVALIIVLIIMALGVLLWSGIKKIYKKSKKHYDIFDD